MLWLVSMPQNPWDSEYFSLRTYPTPKYHYKWDRWLVGLGKVRNNISIGGGRGGGLSPTLQPLRCLGPPTGASKIRTKFRFHTQQTTRGTQLKYTCTRCTLYSFIPRLISKTWFITLFFKLKTRKWINVSTNLRYLLTFQLISSKLLFYIAVSFENLSIISRENARKPDGEKSSIFFNTSWLGA